METGILQAAGDKSPAPLWQSPFLKKYLNKVH